VSKIHTGNARLIVRASTNVGDRKQDSDVGIGYRDAAPNFLVVKLWDAPPPPSL
jgi:hypothetical protein